MSITQGLAELKLLDKRLRSHLDGMNWVDVSTVTNQVNIEKVKNRAVSEYQSYVDLIRRRDSIKRAIVLSNATTRVKIGTWEGTVAEAIEHKASISFKMNLLDAMKEHLTAKREQYEQAKNQMDGRLERLLQSELGKDVKTNPDTLSALTNTFRANNKVEFIDPLDLATKIKELDNEISVFQTNVDWVLSESNGKTLIEVPFCSSQVTTPS